VTLQAQRSPSRFRVLRVKALFCGLRMETAENCRFDGLGDAAMLRLMSQKQDDASLAQEAWEVFYRRNVTYLYCLCKRAYTHIVGEQRVEEVVQDTFIRAFERAATFTTEMTTDPDAQRRVVRAWLGKLSQNIVYDYFRGQPEVDFVDDDILDAYRSEDCSDQSIEENGDSGPQRILLVRDAMASLTDREQQVLRTTMVWYKPGEAKQRMPNRVMAELAASLQTNPTNVRQIRARAIGKIKAYIESHQEIIRDLGVETHEETPQ
jgi:RNA polymerase sigma factor (sigma-70 family)